MPLVAQTIGCRRGACARRSASATAAWCDFTASSTDGVVGPVDLGGGVGGRCLDAVPAVAGVEHQPAAPDRREVGPAGDEGHRQPGEVEVAADDPTDGARRRTRRTSCPRPYEDGGRRSGREGRRYAEPQVEHAVALDDDVAGRRAGAGCRRSRSSACRCRAPPARRPWPPRRRGRGRGPGRPRRRRPRTPSRRRPAPARWRSRRSRRRRSGTTPPGASPRAWAGATPRPRGRRSGDGPPTRW